MLKYADYVGEKNPDIVVPVCCNYQYSFEIQ